MPPPFSLVVVEWVFFFFGGGGGRGRVSGGGGEGGGAAYSITAVPTSTYVRPVSCVTQMVSMRYHLKRLVY